MSSSTFTYLDTKYISAPNQVSWQTAYWTLVPLAVSNMTQPSGRICGQPSRYRTYIRALPLLCAFDVLSIAIRLVHQLCVYRHRNSIRNPFDSIIQARFVDIDAPDDGIQSLEKLTVLRWVFFIIGTAPSAVKILAMSGLPWTKAWAMMYLISFLVVEVMVLLRKNEKAFESSRDSVMQEEADDEHEHRQQRLITSLNPISDSTFNQAVERICFYSALILQIAILTWALLDLWPGSSGVTALSTARQLSYGTLITVEAVYYGAGAACGSFIPVIFLLSGCLSLIHRTSRLLLNRDIAFSTERYLSLIHRTCKWLLNRDLAFIMELQNEISEDGSLLLLLTLIICLFIWIPVSIWVMFSFAGMDDLEPEELFVDIGLELSVVIAMLFQYQVITYFGRKTPLLGRNILVRFQEIGSFDTDGSPREYLDTKACLWLICFLTSFIICTLWYSERYDPSETIDPGWTVVFG